jgi:predicted lipase
VIKPIILAGACSDFYTESGSWDHTWDFGGTYVGHRKIGDADLIVFRGSKDAQDWVHDAEVFPVWDARLGFVHGGFMCGMNDALAEILTVVGSRVVVTGHSLGGARARILAALFAYLQRPVEQCVVFGSPRPGFANLARILQKSATPLLSYRNRNDPVPLVPFMGGLYTHPDPWSNLDEAPPTDDLEPLRDHHIAHYIAGLAKEPS